MSIEAVCVKDCEGGRREMRLNDYQEKAYKAIYPHKSEKDKFLNYVVGLVEEAGEVAKILKHVYWGGEELDKEYLAEELGDVLWYLAALATAAELGLSEIAECNLEKLSKRHPDDKFNVENSINRHSIKNIYDEEMTEEEVEANGLI